MLENIEWVDRGGNIWTAERDVERPYRKPIRVAVRVDGRHAEREGWRADYSGLPTWEAIDGGKGFPSREEAQAYATLWLQAAADQRTLNPRIAR